MNLDLVARFGGWLFATGGTIAVVLAVIPNSSRTNELGLLVTALAAYAAAAVLLIALDRLPLWSHEVGMAWGTLLVTSGIYFLGVGTTAFVVLYFMVAFAAFYFLSWKQAARQLVFIGLCYGFVLLQEESLRGAAQPWLTAVSVMLVLGVLMGRVRERGEALMSRLAEAARTDSLTGLLNRRGFEETFDLEVERAERGERPLSVLIADLDNFKEVNDRSGHPGGDVALRRVSALLYGTKRRIDLAARIGGEEFALILPDTRERGAYLLAERLRRVVKEAFIGDQVPLTISFGVASFPENTESGQELLRFGDQALYAAKALGRDRTVVHSPEIAGTVAAMMHMDNGHEGHLPTVLALAEALDVRDAGTARHSQTVGRYAETTARELRLPEDTVERVRIAAVLHDVGKVGIPDAVLQKPGPLDEEEWRIIKRHPEIGARILNRAGMDDIREWVLAHQERVDGQGYPDGLEGNQIPVEAQIIAVADAYEAMTADRVYRQALTHHEAQTELERCAGTQFDERVVEAFLCTLRRELAPPDARAVA